MRCLTFAMFLGLLQAAAPPHPNLSGTWTMDASRSESAHQDVPIGPVSLNIDQTADQIRIETIRHGDSSETLVFRLGEPEKRDADGPEVSTKAHWDGPKLVAETEREVNGATVTTMHVFTLENNGKDLVVQKTLTVQHGYQSNGSPKTTGKGRDVFIKAPKN